MTWLLWRGLAIAFVALLLGVSSGVAAYAHSADPRPRDEITTDPGLVSTPAPAKSIPSPSPSPSPTPSPIPHDGSVRQAQLPVSVPTLPAESAVVSEKPPVFGTGGLPPGHQFTPVRLVEPPAEPGPMFSWPAEGQITSAYDWEHPLGIDIGVRTGEPILASAAGTVVFAGGDACCLYGLYVDVQHADGYLTRYAHLSVMSVVEGQSVSQGEVIGLGGNTGFSTGPHLHFELLHNGLIQDPMRFLSP